MDYLIYYVELMFVAFAGGAGTENYFDNHAKVLILGGGAAGLQVNYT